MADNINNAKMWREAVAATKDCPGIAVLEAVMEGGAADPQASAHVETCPHCQSELAMLKSFENSTANQNEGAAVAWIAAQLERKQQARPQQQKAAAASGWRAMFRLPYMAAAAALAVAIGLGVSFYINNDAGQPPLHGGGHYGVGPYRSGSIRVTSPSGDLSKAPSQLSWEAWQGASSYNVEITGMDIDHTLVWKGHTAQTSVRITPDIAGKLRPGKPLEWKVTALDASGRELASGKGQFRVALK